MQLSESILSRLQYQHQTAGTLSAGLSEEQLKTRINPDKWSAFENMVHLVSYQPTFIYRIDLMLKEESPLFERYVAEQDPLFYIYLKKSREELLGIMATDRALICRNLQGLKEEQLNRTAAHLKFGILNIPQWADIFLLHEAHHLWTMLQLISPFRPGAKN
jgi:hypothetical protein